MAGGLCHTDRATSVVIETVESREFVGNPLGDPTARRIAVWLPALVRARAGPRYPVIHWLAGYVGTGEMLFSGNPWQPGLGARLDRRVGCRCNPRRLAMGVSGGVAFVTDATPLSGGLLVATLHTR